MSEPAGEKKEKKKGGKLPIVIVLGGMLAAGGYFGMQSRAPKGPVKEPEPELGEIVDMAPEFVVNLREREYFLRATIAFQMDKNSKVHLGGDGGGHGGGGPSAEMIALRDVITERLSSLSVADLRRPDFYARLRRVLASDANRVLHLVAHHEEAAPAKDEKKSKKGEKDKHEAEAHDEPMPKATLYTVTLDPSKLEYPDWDAEEGPILKVYITSFATQRE